MHRLPPARIRRKTIIHFESGRATPTSIGGSGCVGLASCNPAHCKLVPLPALTTSSKSGGFAREFVWVLVGLEGEPSGAILRFREVENIWRQNEERQKSAHKPTHAPSPCCDSHSHIPIGLDADSRSLSLSLAPSLAAYVCEVSAWAWAAFSAHAPMCGARSVQCDAEHSYSGLPFSAEHQATRLGSPCAPVRLFGCNIRAQIERVLCVCASVMTAGQRVRMWNERNELNRLPAGPACALFGRASVGRERSGRMRATPGSATASVLQAKPEETVRLFPNVLSQQFNGKPLVAVLVSQ